MFSLEITRRLDQRALNFKKQKNQGKGLRVLREWNSEEAAASVVLDLFWFLCRKSKTVVEIFSDIQGVKNIVSLKKNVFFSSIDE